MKYQTARRHLPRPLLRYIYSFEVMIEDSVQAWAAAQPQKARVLDAGAGEGQYKHFFTRQRYIGVDLAVGDVTWNYGALDVVADMTSLPFADETFDAALNAVTLEHLRDPARALEEIARVLKPGGTLLLIAPHEWEVHQSPHDYFRFTRHGLRYLLEQAGLEVRRLDPAGGFFRLLSRRLLQAIQFFPGPLKILAALFFLPPALVLPLLDGLDRQSDFTLGYQAEAQKPTP